MRQTLGAAAFVLAMFAAIALFQKFGSRCYLLGSMTITIHLDSPQHLYQRIVLEPLPNYQYAFALSRIDVEQAMREMNGKEVDPASDFPYRLTCMSEDVIDGWGSQLSRYQPRFLLVFAQTSTGQWVSTIEPIPDLRRSRSMTIHLPPPDPPLQTPEPFVAP